MSIADIERQKEYWSKDQSQRRSPDHPAVRALFEPRAEFLATLVDDARQASVLDVGCGNGYYTVPLEKVFGRAAGLDFSDAMLKVNPARERHLGSATELPFVDGEFDIVTCSHLLHHLELADRRKAVREMARVSRRAVVLYEPNRNNPLMFAFGASKREEWMSLEFSPGHMRGLISEARLPYQHVRVEGVIVPNKAPAGYAKLARSLEESPLRRIGFYIRAVANRNAFPGARKVECSAG